ncbi:MAG: hypothetical protein ISN28_09465 [Ectothiorhodospiraceae bacterium AqS1]|nr:hypothetical protein [Ectothiorhodospiraceae bacterium AqS1]
MNSVLTSPESINCQAPGGGITVGFRVASRASVEGAKWAVSKGIDLTIDLGPPSDHINATWTAYDLAVYEAKNTNSADWRARYIQVAQILKPPPAAATKSCAEVDGQTPLPANEYCIVAENLQSSIETEVSQSLKRLIGVDYIYKAEKYLSGTALYPGWKATITFTCAPGIQDCGPAYVPGDRWSDNFLNLVKRTFGLGVKCSDSGNLLDVDSIEPGESVSVTHSSDTERSSPWYRNCEAISGGPFTLSIKTTRLAK